MEATPKLDFNSLLAEEILSKDGPIKTKEALKDIDVVGLYFSASWCPPCATFTPILIERYNKIREAGKKFDIVFVSSDEDENDFNGYYEKMPWLALPFNTEKNNDELSENLGVFAIPT